MEFEKIALRGYRIFKVAIIIRGLGIRGFSHPQIKNVLFYMLMFFIVNSPKIIFFWSFQESQHNQGCPYLNTKVKIVKCWFSVHYWNLFCFFTSDLRLFWISVIAQNQNNKKIDMVKFVPSFVVRGREAQKVFNILDVWYSKCITRPSLNLPNLLH